ncbi:unnamed protein product [Prorocentrum cordatum]|uniref:Uncharacterized protein n=1 Tax=Prorocentrum cordatum TaxID=2364126 RepID=A0ABN9UAY4_9DINO|nr:unnamed protein product [Polarella glacialis]
MEDASDRYAPFSGPSRSLREEDFKPFSGAYHKLGKQDQILSPLKGPSSAEKFQSGDYERELSTEDSSAVPEMIERELRAQRMDWLDRTVGGEIRLQGIACAQVPIANEERARHARQDEDGLFQAMEVDEDGRRYGPDGRAMEGQVDEVAAGQAEEAQMDEGAASQAMEGEVDEVAASQAMDEVAASQAMDEGAASQAMEGEVGEVAASQAMEGQVGMGGEDADAELRSPTASASENEVEATVPAGDEEVQLARDMERPATGAAEELMTGTSMGGGLQSLQSRLERRGMLGLGARSKAMARPPQQQPEINAGEFVPHQVQEDGATAGAPPAPLAEDAPPGPSAAAATRAQSVKPTSAPANVMDEKIRVQVEAARKLLASSVQCQMKMSEWSSRCGGAVIKTLLEQQFKGQQEDMLSAQAILNLLDAVAQKEDGSLLDAESLAEDVARPPREGKAAVGGLPPLPRGDSELVLAPGTAKSLESSLNEIAVKRTLSEAQGNIKNVPAEILAQIEQLQNGIKDGIKARSNVYQQFGRWLAQKIKQDPKFAEDWDAKAADDRRDYRTEWAQRKLTELKRKYIHKRAYKMVDESVGTYFSFSRIVVENAIAARRYCEACIAMGGEWLTYCSLTQRVKFFYVSLQRREVMERSWSEHIENEDQAAAATKREAPEEGGAEQPNAKRGRRGRAVTDGADSHAEITPEQAAAKEAKKKVATAEQAAKKMLSQFQQLTQSVDTIKHCMAAMPEWKWLKDHKKNMDDLGAVEKAVADSRTDLFNRMMSEEMKMIKKDYADADIVRDFNQIVTKTAGETDSECDSDEPRDPEAGMSFVNELIEMYLLGKPMNARHMSVLCHYAWKGGLLEAKPYAVNPESKGRNHQRKIDKALNLERFDARMVMMFQQGGHLGIPETTQKLAAELLKQGEFDLSPAEWVTVAARVVNEHMAHVPVRDLDLLEAKAFREHGCETREFDRESRDATEDLTSLAGMIHVGLLALRIKPKGLITIALECSTWLGFTSNHTHGRTNDNIYGHEEMNKVKEANMCADVAAWLIFLCHARDVFYVLEKPVQSRLYSYPAIESSLDICGASQALTYLGAFTDDQTIPKAVHLATSLPKHTWAHFTRPKPKKELSTDQKSKFHFVTKEGWVCSGNQLKSTQYYPPAYCHALHAAWEEACLGEKQGPKRAIERDQTSLLRWTQKDSSRTKRRREVMRYRVSEFIVILLQARATRGRGMEGRCEYFKCCVIGQVLPLVSDELVSGDMRIWCDVSDGWCIVWRALDGSIKQRGMWEMDPHRTSFSELLGSLAEILWRDGSGDQMFPEFSEGLGRCSEDAARKLRQQYLPQLELLSQRSYAHAGDVELQDSVMPLPAGLARRMIHRASATRGPSGPETRGQQLPPLRHPLTDLLDLPVPPRGQGGERPLLGGAADVEFANEGGEPRGMSIENNRQVRVDTELLRSGIPQRRKRREWKRRLGGRSLAMRAAHLSLDRLDAAGATKTWRRFMKSPNAANQVFDAATHQNQSDMLKECVPARVPRKHLTSTMQSMKPGASAEVGGGPKPATVATWRKKRMRKQHHVVDDVAGLRRRLRALAAAARAPPEGAGAGSSPRWLLACPRPPPEGAAGASAAVRQALRRDCRRAEEELAALRGRAPAPRRGEAAAAPGDDRPLSGSPTYARLHDGRQVELTSKVQQQAAELEELRRRLNAIRADG